MIKKTTVYLSIEDLSLLRKIATTRNITIAEAIRNAIKDACKPKNMDEQKVWDALDKIWAKTSSMESQEIENAVDKAVNEVRDGKIISCD